MACPHEMALSATHTEMLPAGLEAINVHKETFKPLKEVRAPTPILPNVTTPPADLSLKIARDQFELQISNTTDLDDPIEPFLLYIKWISKTHPQAQPTSSGLVQLLEKCTSEFRDAAFYKDDPRYLGVWMRYIKYSTAPRDMFIYLAKKEIGKNLATFYEEYAAHLESINLRRLALTVYEAGLSAQARPIERLRRKHREFLNRLAKNPPDPNEPASPAALPAPPRNALSLKLGGSPVPQPQSTQKPQTGWGKPSKLAIFKDPVCISILFTLFVLTKVGSWNWIKPAGSDHRQTP